MTSFRPFRRIRIRLLKNAHLLRFPHPSSLRRTFAKYASIDISLGLRTSGALHLGIFEQPEENDFFSNPLDSTGSLYHSGLLLDGMSGVPAAVSAFDALVKPFNDIQFRKVAGLL
jgi:hypothetical protein